LTIKDFVSYCIAMQAKRSRREKSKAALKTLIKEPIEAKARGKRWSPAEVNLHLATIESMLLNSYGITTIRRVMRERFGVGSVRTNVLSQRVRDLWINEDAESRPLNKAAAARRFLRYIRQAQGDETHRPDFSTLAKFESLLADVQGTRAPLEINVDVRLGEAAKLVIAGLSAQQLNDRLEAVRERRALAESAKKMLGPRVIDAVGVAS